MSIGGVCWWCALISQILYDLVKWASATWATGLNLKRGLGRWQPPCVASRRRITVGFLGGRWRARATQVLRPQLLQVKRLGFTRVADYLPPSHRKLSQLSQRSGKNHEQSGPKPPQEGDTYDVSIGCVARYWYPWACKISGSSLRGCSGRFGVRQSRATSHGEHSTSFKRRQPRPGYGGLKIPVTLLMWVEGVCSC